MKYLAIVCLIIINQYAFAQAEPGMDSGIFRLERGTFNGQQGMIGRKLPPSDVVGDYYLDTTWHQGSFTTSDGRSSATYPLRYDIENAILEIKWGKLVKVAGEEELTSFTWKKNGINNQTFVNARSFSHNGSPMAGFVELLYQGSDTLVLQMVTTLKEADYVPGLDMGNRNSEILKKGKYFIIHNGQAIPIKNKGNFLEYASVADDKRLKKYMRQRRINVKEASDLVALLQYYEGTFDH